MNDKDLEDWVRSLAVKIGDAQKGVNVVGKTRQETEQNLLIMFKEKD